MLRRAFWLCNIQDRNHAPLFVFGGLTTFEILSSYTIAKWTQFQKSAAKWRNCPVVLNDNHIQSLTAVSLWIRVRIVLGEHDNLTALSRAEVSHYARTEVCVENTVDEVDLYPLSKANGNFAEFYRQFQSYLNSIITSDDLMLSYVTRRGHTPVSFTSLRHELQWLVPVNSNTASWKRDNKQVYYLLKKAIGDDSNARNWMNKDGAEGTWDGRRSMMSLVELYESDNEHEAKLRALRDKIKGQKYTGYGNNNARKLTSRLYDIYSQFDLLHEPVSEVEKLRNLRSFLHPQGLMSNAYFVNNLKQEIDKALKDARSGAAVNYSIYTSKLTSGESEWLKDNEKSAKVSSASTSVPSTSNASAPTTEKATKADQGWNSVTGEPTHRYIFGVDITVVYEQTHKLEEEDFWQIPKIVKDYFIANPTKKCPPRFYKMEKPKPTKKKRKKKKKED